MMRTIVRACLALAIPGALRAQSPVPSAPDSVQRFVQGFYSWYMRVAEDDDAPWMRAVRDRRADFAPSIVDGLRADSVAAESDDDEAAGIDADPFLNAQDPCDSYRVRRVLPAADGWLVEVLGVGGCATHGTPDVVVEVKRRDGGFVFTDFRYPGPPADHLVALLERERKGKEP